MHGASRAFVVHHTAARIRIKIPDRQWQEAYFGTLQRALLQHPDILRVHANPLTASVIIECRNGLAFLTQACRFPGLELLPVEPHLCGRNSPTVAAGWEGNHSSSSARMGVLVCLIQLLVALATKQLGPQLAEWVAHVVGRAAGGMAAPQRLAPPPVLLVTLAA